MCTLVAATLCTALWACSSIPGLGADLRQYYVSTPVQVRLLSRHNIVQVAAGGYFSLALTSLGKVRGRDSSFIIIAKCRLLFVRMSLTCAFPCVVVLFCACGGSVLVVVLCLWWFYACATPRQVYLFGKSLTQPSTSETSPTLLTSLRSKHVMRMVRVPTVSTVTTRHTHAAPLAYHTPHAMPQRALRSRTSLANLPWGT